MVGEVVSHVGRFDKLFDRGVHERGIRPNAREEKELGSSDDTGG